MDKPPFQIIDHPRVSTSCLSILQVYPTKMKFLAFVITAFSAAAVANAQCTAERRINTMRSITDAFNEKDFFKSAAAIQAFPLQRDCPAIVSASLIKCPVHSTNSKTELLTVHLESNSVSMLVPPRISQSPFGRHLLMWSPSTPILEMAPPLWTPRL